MKGFEFFVRGLRYFLGLLIGSFFVGERVGGGFIFSKLRVFMVRLVEGGKFDVSIGW